MTDSATGAALAVASSKPTAEALLAAVADAVLSVPGVARLEPTLRTAGPGMLLRRHPTDGVRLLDRAGVVDVDVDVATTATHQARAVTHQVRASIATVLAAHGYTPGPVTVSVLEITPC